MSPLSDHEELVPVALMGHRHHDGPVGGVQDGEGAFITIRSSAHRVPH
jgi:hypothetical protein